VRCNRSDQARDRRARSPGQPATRPAARIRAGARGSGRSGSLRNGGSRSLPADPAANLFEGHPIASLVHDMPHELDFRVIEEEEAAFGASGWFDQPVAEVKVEL